MFCSVIHHLEMLTVPVSPYTETRNSKIEVKFFEPIGSSLTKQSVGNLKVTSKKAAKE